MLSKYAIRRCVRHTRQLNYNIRNCKCVYNTIGQKNDSCDQIKEQSTPENNEVTRNGGAKSRKACSSRFGLNIRRPEIQECINIGHEFDALENLKAADFQTHVREQTAFVGQSSGVIVKNPINVRLNGTVVSANKLFCPIGQNARSFHNSAHVLFCLKDSASDLQSCDADTANLNHELDAKIEENILSQVNVALAESSSEECADETLSAEFRQDKLSNYQNDPVETTIKTEMTDIAGQYINSTYKDGYNFQTKTDPDTLGSETVSDADVEGNEVEKIEFSENLEMVHMANVDHTLEEELFEVDEELLEDNEEISDLSDKQIAEGKADVTKAENAPAEYAYGPDRQGKAVFPIIYSLAPLVNQSETLSALVKLGVDLTVIEKKGLANKIVKMNFQKCIKPHMLVLHRLGVPDDKLGNILTKNPHLFLEDVENVKVRIQYLESKKFKREDICEMVSNNSLFLLMTSEKIDTKLGFYQKLFQLTGSQVRKAIIRCPRSLTYSRDSVKIAKLKLSELMGFSELQVKQMFINDPKLFFFTAAQYSLREKMFELLYKTMEIPHSLIVKFPEILRNDRMKLEERHRFLLKVGRAQYDPSKENYVSLKALIQSKDDDFCVNLAKASVTEFYKFLKTI